MNAKHSIVTFFDRQCNRPFIIFIIVVIRDKNMLSKVGVTCGHTIMVIMGNHYYEIDVDRFKWTSLFYPSNRFKFT